MEKQGIHVAIVCDGNRRWAKSRGIPQHEGHQFGFKAIREEIIPALSELEEPTVSELSLYVFSTENWNRPPEEVLSIMQFCQKKILELVPELNEQGIKLVHAGSRESLNDNLLSVIDEAVTATSHNTKLQLNLCLNYGSKEERQQAAVRAAANNEPEKIDDYMYVTTPVDILFRPGGEKRASGFLAHQSDYAEYIFSDTLLPDITKSHITGPAGVIAEFTRRDRRMGGNSRHNSEL